MSVNVLYVNHTGQVSGGERSLLELLRGVQPSVSPMVACPGGPLTDYLRAAGVPRAPIPGTDGSLKLHPIHTSVAVAEMLRAARAVHAVARRHGAELVHANSIRAGLIALLARRLGGPPVIVHLRDCLPRSTTATLTLRAINHADVLIANSRYTASSLSRIAVPRNLHILGNPVDLDRFDPAAISRVSARHRVGLARHEFALTILAQITPWKGQEEAIRAIAQIKARHPEVRLLIIGSAKFLSRATRYDNRAYLTTLRTLVEELGLAGQVRFLGERDDVPEVLRATDALLVPSWEEPFGRSVVEAMAMRVPVIATEVGGPAEVITDGENGLLRAPKDPVGWANAISTLIEDGALRERLAESGWQRSRAFSVESHGGALVELYNGMVNRGGPNVTPPAERPAVLDAVGVA